MTQKLVTQKEYAVLRGCAPSAVTRAVKEGRITLVLIAGKKMVDVALADRQWAQNSRARGDSRSAGPIDSVGESGGAHRFASPGKPMDADGGQHVVDVDKTLGPVENHFPDTRKMVDRQADQANHLEHPLGMVPPQRPDLISDEMSYDVARRRREAAEARIAEMKQAEMEGALIRVDAVRNSFANKISGARDALLQIPSRLAPLLAAESDLLKVTQALEDELRQALAELSGAAA